MIQVLTKGPHMNRLSALKLFLVMVLTVCIMLPTWGQAKPESPKAPPEIIALARNAVQSISGTLPAIDPDTQKVKVDDETGYTIWEFYWQDKDVSVEVNADLLKVISYVSMASYEANVAAVSAGLQPAITKEQALSTVSSIWPLLGLEPGDLRLSDATLNLSDNDYSTTYWRIDYDRYIDNLPANNGGVLVQIDAYNGAVEFWSADYKTYLPIGNGPFYPETQARAVAVNAFQQGGGPITLLPALLGDSPSWSHIAPNSPLCSLTYVYIFSTDNMIVQAIVDAQTGELWSIENLLLRIKPGLTLKTVKSSPRMKLVSALLADKKSSGLGRAMVAGKPLKNASTGKGSKQFTWAVDKRYVDFSMNAKTCTLAWKDGGKTWSGVILSASEEKQLEAWKKEKGL